MKKMIIGAALAAGIFAAGETAQAGGYGAAGCGLGSLVFGNKAGIMQIFAATTNGITANQTFGITTGTLNCNDTSGGGASAKAFIETNREALAKDISRGNGETIKNLATLSGCADATAVGVTLQKNFSQIFPTSDVTNTQVSGSVIGVLKSDKTLACARLI